MNEMVGKIRNIALVAHGGAGKTSLAEALIFNSGATKRLGKVDDGNSTLDFQDEEIERKISMTSHFYNFPWKNHNISLIDTPGDQNFFSAAKTCMIAADTVIMVVDSVDKVGVRTELASEFAEQNSLPVIFFINKMDRDRADFEGTVDALGSLLSPKPILVQLPIGSESSFSGIVDLVANQAYTFENGKAKKTDIPADMQDTVATEREQLIENVAEADDELLERYLEGEDVTADDIQKALKKGISERVFAPVLCGSATANIGVEALINFVVDYAPSPADRGPWAVKDDKGNDMELTPDPDGPFAALVFHTIADPYAGRLSVMRVISGSLETDGRFFNSTKDERERYNQLLNICGKEQKTVPKVVAGSICAVAKLKETLTGHTLCDESKPVIVPAPEPLKPLISFAVAAKAKGDEDKLFSSLGKIMEEDTALRLERNAETRQILLSGMGMVHIECIVEKLKRKYNVEVELHAPKVPYRETIRKKVRVQGRHKKQSGGHGQFGDCWIVMEPLPRGGGFEFVDQIVGGSIPRQFIPAVEKGVIEAAVSGVLAKCNTVDFRVTVDDGSYHSVDSSEMAFKIAGSLAFKKAALEAKPVLLEPIMNMTVTTPDEFMGDIMGDMNSRRGRVMGMDSVNNKQVIKAQVPMAEALTYSNQLQSMTGGRGTFEMEFSHYDEVPSDLSGKIVEELNAASED